ncbi:hypothetical protein [Porphyromonas crevioricanis]|uniref:Uncharacterized protein n=2 Tax=Porphyromonas crevioricanis TaxID=393921 RepID=A0A2X4PQ57_9PORP|nr:hypothetical protein [Porphyromonas crevioricanis]GAD05416.1 hypothetical protein PORCRE_1118 [Porphyromonas crevioricanis JCM 15906]GAD07640.1 hypothetical protein PORCAN_1264 [Porphyromonas crevioricanis JCM 13913]SJZ89564.1 hypothetical protein SAMN02745203_01200 [Porphyromonas crevioricanis]SQH73668.1 Uncharacterised protein [Porphyromonas crevioricanis]
MNKLIKVLVGIAALVMIYLTVMSILTPVQFDKKQKEREVLIQKQLKGIATLQQAYEGIFGKYADAAHLRWFFQEGRIYYINAEGEYTDDMRDKGLSEREAARQGLLRRDTVWVPVIDTLLVGSGITPDNLLDVPGSSDKKITIETGSINQEVGNDTIAVPVYRAYVKFVDYLGDMDHVILQQKIRASEERVKGFPGLVIGSLEEVKNTGNWE